MKNIKDIFLFGEDTYLLNSIKNKIPDRIIQYNEFKFSNDNFIYKIDELKMKDRVIILADLSYNVNKNLLGLFFLIDYLNLLNVKVDKLIFPYFPYSRSNNIHKFHTFNLHTIVKLLNLLDIKNIYTIDPHFGNQKFNFPSPKISYLKHKSIFSEELEKKLYRCNIEELLVLSPDKGSINRAKNIAQICNSKFLFFDKFRSTHGEIVNYKKKLNKNKISLIKNQKILFIVDDEISSGNTLLKMVDIIKKINPDCTILVFITHCFNENLNKILRITNIESIFFSNTIDSVNMLEDKKIKIIDVSKIIINKLLY